LREIKRKAIERQHEVEDKPKGFEKGLKEKDSRLKLRQTLEERIQSLSWPTTLRIHVYCSLASHTCYSL